MFIAKLVMNGIAGDVLSYRWPPTQVEGMLMRLKLNQSSIDLGVRLKLARSLSEELKDILPLLRIKADSEGFYNFSIKGKLAKPRLGR